MKKAEQIIFFGKLIEKYNLISSHSGNISVKIGENILITKTGTMLGNLNFKDLTLISLEKTDDPNFKYSSMETIVHRSIYKNSNAEAIIHTHPLFAITVGNFLKNKFIPIDSEGRFLLSEVPIIKVKKTIASEEVAEKVSIIANKYKIAIIKTHGVFAWEKNLEKAFYLTTALENSAKIFYQTKKWKREKS